MTGGDLTELVHPARTVLAEIVDYVGRINAAAKTAPDSFFDHPEVRVDLECCHDTMTDLFGQLHRCPAAAVTGPQPMVTVIGDLKVSTIPLPRPDDNGNRYETAVLIDTPDGRDYEHHYTARYRTIEEAARGHVAVCETVEDNQPKGAAFTLTGDEVGLLRSVVGGWADFQRGGYWDGDPRGDDTLEALAVLDRLMALRPMPATAAMPPELDPYW